MPQPASLEVDLHVHSVASGHAYSTVGEIAEEAARRGLRAFAMTDHGPGLPGGPHPYHFMALRFIPKYLHGVRVFTGVEANVMADGRLDLSDEELAKLDVVLAGFHEECGFDGRGKEINTRTLLSLMDNPLVRVISHPGNPNFPVDYEAVVRHAVTTRTALEINNSSFTISRRGSGPNCLEIARLCARYQAPVCVGSDAHIAQGVGEFEDGLQALQQAGVSLQQVVNRTMETTLDFFGLE